MSQRTIKLVDTVTGVDLTNDLKVVAPRKPSIYREFVQVCQMGVKQLAVDKSLAGLPTRVILYLIGELDFENFIQIKQKDIAKALCVYESDISATLKLLVSKGILLKGNKVGRSYTYRLSLEYGWKGSNKKAREYQLELIKGGKTNNE